MLYRTLLTSLVAISASLQSVTAHPGHDHGDDFHPISNLQLRQADASRPFSAARFPDVQKVLQGNAQFQQQRNAAKIQNLVEDGQKPPFALITCSDSRVPEATIFNSEPGTFFVERNIANQYKPGDENAQSVINYGVRVLGVQHIVVMGHYGCGGIAAAIATPARENIDVSGHIIQSWIGDVRQLYLSSNRTEIVEMRDANQAKEAQGELVEEPDRREAGFRALVEENVKQQVQRLATSSLMINLNAEVVINLNTDGSRRAAEGAAEQVGIPPEAEGGKSGEELPLIPVFIHGWVHDIETGAVIDLNISVGPAGFENFVPSPEAPAAGGEQPAEGGAEAPPAGGEAPAAGGEAPAEGGAEAPAAGETPAAGGEAPAEGGAETPAASGGGESPAPAASGSEGENSAGEGGANEGGANEGGANEGASNEGAAAAGGTSASVSVNVIGVHFKPSASSGSTGAVPVKRAESRLFGSTLRRSQSRRSRQSQPQARHEDEVQHDHQARHEAEAEHDHQVRSYPPPVKMFRRKRSVASSS